MHLSDLEEKNYRKKYNILPSILYPLYVSNIFIYQYNLWKRLYIIINFWYTNRYFCWMRTYFRKISIFLWFFKYMISQGVSRGR